jgi:protein-tyrosine phosphatase
MTVPTSRIPGIGNFRSLEGIPAAGGRRIRPGVLYRSEALVDLSAEASDVLAALGIRTLCDLRSPSEQARHPLRWPGRPPERLEVDVLPDARVAGEVLIHRILADTTGEVARETLLENARAMPAAFAGSVRRLFDAIVDHEAVPLLVACAAGKDRTGYVVTVILLALGASHDEIVREFMRSADHIDSARLHAEMVGWLDAPPAPALSVDALHEVGVRAEYVDAALDAILDEHGSHEAFLEVVGGLDETRTERLRDILLL